VKQSERHKKCQLYGCGENVGRANVAGCSRQGRNNMAKQAKNTICLWYNGDAEDAAPFFTPAPFFNS